MNIPTQEGWYWLKMDNFPLAVYCRHQRAYGGRLCAQIYGQGIVPVEEAKPHWKWESLPPMGSGDELAEDHHKLQVSYDQLFDYAEKLIKALKTAKACIEYPLQDGGVYAGSKEWSLQVINDALITPSDDELVGQQAMIQESLARHCGDYREEDFPQ